MQIVRPVGRQAASRKYDLLTALGLTITPLLAKLGKRLGRRIDRAAPATEDSADDTVPRAIIIGFGRVGRLVAELVRAVDEGAVDPR